MRRSNGTRKRRLRKLNGVFFGTSPFAVPALHAFAAAVECSLVVTQPDRPGGRGQRLQATAVKTAALQLGIATLQPERLRGAVDQLRAQRADLFAVASYGKIVPQAILDVPRLGALNVHPSLLPLYRGATPLQAQLRDGVAESGVTLILMDAGMDTGDIVLREVRAIAPAETYGEVHDRFARLGADMLAEACALAASGTLRRTPQAGLASPEAIAATLTRPLTKEDLVVDWRRPARAVVNTIRALSPQPGARAMLDGEAQPVKILQARVATVEPPLPSELSVRCGDGAHIVVERLVPPNRSAMTGIAYLAARTAAASRSR